MQEDSTNITQNSNTFFAPKKESKKDETCLNYIAMYTIGAVSWGAVAYLSCILSKTYEKEAPAVALAAAITACLFGVIIQAIDKIYAPAPLYNNNLKTS